MPLVRRGPTGELTRVTDPAELDELYNKCMERARSRTERPKSAAEVNASLEVANKIWEERLSLLAQKRDRISQQLGSGRGPVEDDELNQLQFEIYVRDNMLFDVFFNNIDAFCAWMKHNKDGEEALRVYGYSVRIAERLGCARRANPQEKEELWDDMQKRGKPSFATVIYRGVPYVPTDREKFRGVFYCLEGLRRAAKPKRKDGAENEYPEEENGQ